MRLPWLIPAALFAVSPLLAQPVVNQGGVLNAASFTRDGLPGDGIAQGGMFVVFGQGMGPASLVQAESIPLTTELAGTSIEITVAGQSVQALPLFTFTGQIAAVLPSNTPVGPGTLTVTFNGQTSAPVAVKVTQNAFGIFTRNQAGYGPAILQNFISQTEAPLNTLVQAAQPGQVVILWGTGLGPIDGDDAQLPPVGSLPFDVEVILGGREIVTPFYAGRSPQFPGIDQVNFTIPANLEGCYVSVAVRVNGVVSNFGMLSISGAGRHCSGPFTPEQMMLAESSGRLRVGAATVTTGPEVEPEVESEAGDYSLAQLTSSTLTFIGFETHITPLGTCTVWPAGDDFFPVDPVEPIELLGGDLTFTTPAGTLTENDELPGNFFPPGLFTIRSTAGPQIGAFEISTTIPPPGTLNAPDEPERISRSQDLTVRWSGVTAADQMVLLLGRSDDQTRGVGRTFVCSADGPSGQFTVPSAVLQSLPPSVGTGTDENAPGFLLVGSTPRPETARADQVPGIDAGFFAPIQLFGVAMPDYE